jgi:hypothetical protein
MESDPILPVAVNILSVGGGAAVFGYANKSVIVATSQSFRHGPSC